MIGNILTSTLLSLKAHKLRVFLTMIGIIIGISSVVAISTLGEGMRQSIVQATMRSMDTNTMKIQYLPEGVGENEYYYGDSEEFQFLPIDLKMLRNVEGIEAIYPQYDSGMGSGNISQGMDYFGVQSHLNLNYDRGDKEIAYGRDFQPRDANKDVLILNGEIFEYELKDTLAPEDLIGKAVSLSGQMFQVIGVTKPYDWEAQQGMTSDMTTNWDLISSSFVPKQAYNNLTKNKPISAIQLKLHEDADRSAILGAVSSLMTERYPDIKGSFGEDDYEARSIEEMQSAIGGITMFLMAITAISLLVGGIGVMNIMYVSVAERKREIGIRRAIGAKPRMILWQFLLEAASITLLGGLIGVLLGYGLSQVVGNFIDIKPAMTSSIFLISTGVSALTGIAFGIIPAFSAARMDPIKAIYN